MKEEESFIHTNYGYCYYEIKENKGLIYNLYIEESYRHQGLAKHLLSMIINEIKQINPDIKEIYIGIDSNNKNIDINHLYKFYASLGLEVDLYTEEENESE